MLANAGTATRYGELEPTTNADGDDCRRRRRRPRGHVPRERRSYSLATGAVELLARIG